MNIDQVIQHFAIEGSMANAQPYGGGHINDTYHVVNSDPAAPAYLLQKINHKVFGQVEGLMHNIAFVTSHIRKKLLSKRDPGIHEKVLTLIHTKEGKWFYHHGEEYWRVFRFMKNLRSYDHPETTAQVYEGAKAFGQFLSDLTDFSSDQLCITIPRFHDLEYRLQQFSQALEVSHTGRKGQAIDQIKFVKDTAGELLVLQDLVRKGRVPLRVTHNDTKFNNVLLDEKDKGKCVIDLDTVMPGLVHYDFGDGIRTGSVTCEEDEADLSIVDVDIAKYEAYTEGYLDATREVLTPSELESLHISAPFMAFIMGVRFLTDYLAGDVYYKIDSPGHNLQRAKCQLHLSKVMLDRKKEIAELIQRHYEVPK